VLPDLMGMQVHVGGGGITQVRGWHTPTNELLSSDSNQWPAAADR